MDKPSVGQRDEVDRLTEQVGRCAIQVISLRFVRKLRATHPERVWRMECQPGEEIQLDFGLGAPID